MICYNNSINIRREYISRVEYYYDGQGNVLRETDNLSQSAYYSYDDLGNQGETGEGVNNPFRYSDEYRKGKLQKNTFVKLLLSYIVCLALMIILLKTNW